MSKTRQKVKIAMMMLVIAICGGLFFLPCLIPVLRSLVYYILLMTIMLMHTIPLFVAIDRYYKFIEMEDKLKELKEDINDSENKLKELRRI